LFFRAAKTGTHLSEERSLLQVRFKEQCQMPGLVLKIEEMEDFLMG